MQILLDNGLERSIQGWNVILGTRHHLLAVENYFLIHQWTPDDIPSVLNIEQELRTLHRTLGNMSAEVFKMLLSSANGLNTDSQIVKILKNIGNDCKVCKKVTSGVRKPGWRWDHRSSGSTTKLKWTPIILAEELWFPWLTKRISFAMPRFSIASRKRRYAYRFSRCSVSSILAHPNTRL